MTIFPDGPWLRTSEAVVQLGISRETLMRRRAEGYFSEGVHWIATGPYRTSSVMWNIEACRQSTMPLGDGPEVEEKAPHAEAAMLLGSIDAVCDLLHDLNKGVITDAWLEERSQEYLVSSRESLYDELCVLYPKDILALYACLDGERMRTWLRNNLPTGLRELLTEELRELDADVI